MKLKSKGYSGFGVTIRAAEAFKPAVAVEKDKDANTHAVMLTFHPSWTGVSAKFGRF